MSRCGRLSRRRGIGTGSALVAVFQQADGWLRPPRPSRRASSLGLISGLVPAVALLCRLASEPTAILAYCLLAGYSIFGRAQAIQALALVWLFTLLNPGLAPAAPGAGGLRFVVLGAAAAGVLACGGVALRRFRFDGLVLATLALGSFLSLHAVLVSPFPDVSLLKAVSWTIAMSTLLGAWRGLTTKEHHQVTQQVFVGLSVLLVLSLPLVVLPVGYLRNGTGFQGVLDHPQPFGATMALLCVWAVARVLERPRPDILTMAVGGLAFMAVVLSESRTAGFSVIIGLGTAVLVCAVRPRRNAGPALPGLRSARVFVLLSIAGFGAIAAAPLVAEQAWHFVTKSGRAEVSSLGDAYEVSRGRLIEAMLANVEAQPWLGIGFGIASDPSAMIVERDPLFGVPLSAPIEKGVTPLAIVEECGLIGALLVALWLVPIYRNASATGVTTLAVSLTVLALNMGEAILFSPGGMGLLLILILAWSAVGRSRGPSVAGY